MNGTTSQSALQSADPATDAAQGTAVKRMAGTCAVAVMFSHYPDDPRPRRAAEALVNEGATVEVICLRKAAGEPVRERFKGVEVTRVPLKRRRGGKFSYVLQYAWFIFVAGAIIAFRSCRRRYHVVHIHNMPDVLVFSALIPKLMGARVVLDLHDPMPELMMGIFGMKRQQLGIRMLEWLEKYSIRFADLALTPNIAFKQLFTARSCPGEKIEVIMNSPDENIFRFRERATGAAEGPVTQAVIMYHGALVERHGLDVAVQALRRVRAVVATAELRVCGAPTPFLDAVMCSLKELGLEKAVKYMGPKTLDEIVEEIDRCDVGVIPNRRSAFTEINMPTRIFEYLARGKPVIAPRTAGIRDYFKEDQIVFFEPDDPEDLASKLRWVLTEKHAADEVVRRGQRVYQNHQWCEQRARFVGLIAALVKPDASTASIPELLAE